MLLHSYPPFSAFSQNWMKQKAILCQMFVDRSVLSVTVQRFSSLNFSSWFVQQKMLKIVHFVLIFFLILSLQVEAFEILSSFELSFAKLAKLIFFDQHSMYKVRTIFLKIFLFLPFNLKKILYSFYSAISISKPH